MVSTVEELVQRMDAGWEAFSTAVGRLPAASLDEHTASGWTLAAMLAHITAWHDATAFRIHRFAATGHAQPKVEEDDDRFNARVATESVRRTPDQIVAALHASFGRLREAVATLDVLDEEGWVEHVVSGNAYEHHAEHQAELDAVLMALQA